MINVEKLTQHERLEILAVTDLLELSLYYKANNICKKYGIDECRIDKRKPNGPDDNHVFYLHEYFPKDIRDERFSEKIRELKKGDTEAAYDFGMEILGVLKLLKRLTGSRIIHLTCIPPHIAETDSNMVRCMEYCKRLNDDPELTIYTDTIWLERIKDVSPSHYGFEFKPEVWEHYDSIECYTAKGITDKHGVILLDDVTTTGRQMKACRKHLINKGINQKRLISLVLGKTISLDEICESENN